MKKKMKKKNFNKANVKVFPAVNRKSDFPFFYILFFHVVHRHFLTQQKIMKIYLLSGIIDVSLFFYVCIIIYRETYW